MKANEIIEKARSLGFDPGDGINELQKLRNIANQLGVEDLGEVEDALNNMLVNNTDNIVDDTIDELVEDEVFDEPPLTRKEEFGKKEYDAARDENGNYDKDYYANRGKELDNNVEAARQERNNNFKNSPEENNGSNDDSESENKEITPTTPRGRNGKISNQQVSNTESSGTIPKSRWDRARDNVNLANAQKERTINKINSAKSKAYQVTHPGEVLKDKAKTMAVDATKAAGSAGKKLATNAGKTVGKAAANGAKAAGEAALAGLKTVVSYLAANPVVLAVVIVGILVLLILVILFNGYYEYEEEGYYEAECNFNTTTVELQTCKTDEVKEITLQDYVIGMSASYAQGKFYSEETLKALMIVLKTNVLSKGNYDSSTKYVKTDDCAKKYTDPFSVGGSGTKKLESIYRTIEEELFISTSYKDVISNLSPRNQLLFDESILKEMEKLADKDMTYDQILDEKYNPKDNNSVDIEDTKRDSIFVGDSRIRDMVTNGTIPENKSVYGIDAGYPWFGGGATAEGNCTSGAIRCVNSKISSNENIVIWLGVNDVNNYETYYKRYYGLANNEWSNHNIYIVSVGYVDESKYSNVTNSQIQTFNFEMKKRINGSGLSNLEFIDLEFNAVTMGDQTLEDGISYNATFLNQIYNKIDNYLGSVSSFSVMKAIYKLSTYCTYYTYTPSGNTYWWPVGSSNETAPGIYGGDPISTTVTSPFGMRLHPVYGTYKMHTGIDVGVTCGSPLIAPKAGTITEVLGSCTGSNNGCGGGYGNYVHVDHGDGTSSFFGHMSSVSVSVGDKVVQGQKVGLSGTTGTSTGCHLHFEIRLNGSQVDPLDYISAENPRPVSEFGLGDIDDSSIGSASETKSAICKALKNGGFSDNAVAATLANIAAEGALRTNNLEDCYEEDKCCTVNGKKYGFCVHTEIRGFGSDTKYTQGVDSGNYPRQKFVNDWAGYGLIQWTYPTRKAGLYDYAKNQNKSIAALSVQLGYFLQEVKGYPTTWKYLTGSYSAYDTAYNFCVDYEGPAFPCNSRGSKAEQLVSYVKGGCN